jgi:hypothetical protein
MIFFIILSVGKGGNQVLKRKKGSSCDNDLFDELPGKII